MRALLFCATGEHDLVSLFRGKHKQDLLQWNWWEMQ